MAEVFIENKIHFNSAHRLHAHDLSEKEIADFLENLTQTQFGKIQNFFATMPRLKHVVNVTNPKTKKKGTVTLTGMQSFF